MPNTSNQRSTETLPTLPPGPADAAALEHCRRLVADGTDRSAAFWAETERAARVVGVKP